MNKNKSRFKKLRSGADESYLGVTIDAMIRDFMKEKEIDGLGMAIVQAPYIPRIVGYGLADSKQKRLASSNTMWPIGPISQGFAAIAIMQVYEDNNIDINENISKYLDDIPSKWNGITILDLLRHASGIKDYSLNIKFDPFKENSFEDLIALVANDNLMFKPGTSVNQSATNFLLITEIIERTTHESYHDFITRRQINFLNLRHTGFATDVDNFNHEDISLTNNVHKYFKSDKKFIDPTEFAASYVDSVEILPIESSALKGFTDLWSSAQDVSFWDIALAGSVLIKSAANRDLIYEPWTLPNGTIVPAVAGWQFYNHPGLMDIKGTVKGYSSFLSRFTNSEELVCVTLLANKEGIDFTNLARRIAASYSDLLATGYNDNKLYLLESQFSVDTMVKRLESELKRRNIQIFSKYDHSENAKEVNLNLRPTTVVVFGSPKVGTYLMQEDQSVSLELPLKISMWKDEKGSTWIGFERVREMLAGYNISNLTIMSNMEQLLEYILTKVANIY